MDDNDNISTQSEIMTTSTRQQIYADRVVEGNMLTDRTVDQAYRDSTLVYLLNNVHPVNTHTLQTCALMASVQWTTLFSACHGLNQRLQKFILGNLPFAAVFL